MALRAGVRRSPTCLPAHDNIAATEQLDLVRYHEAVAQRLAIASQWRRFHATYPVVLGPVSTQQMFPKEFDLTGPAATTELWQAHRLLVTVNLLGLPSLALPMGVSAEGLPEGVQLIATTFGEAACLAAGRDIETAVGSISPLTPVMA
ncbi:amidase family protein [Nocardioides sp.]|uniref:amidase family protein n=1 Tax=Nocardioides sp. TaxID=35761 RepID=UPI002D7F9965|nr:amidase family protein [Nocardioides sp.]